MLVAIPATVLIINYSTFGKKISTTGLSTSASTYAGINIQKKRMIAMMISGLLAGLLGAMIYCGQTNQVFVTISAKTIPTEGFNGISVALLGVSNPIGVIFSGLFIAYLTAGGFYLQLFHFSKEIIDIIIAIIIYFSAFALIIKKIMEKIKKRNEHATSQDDTGAAVNQDKPVTAERSA